MAKKLSGLYERMTHASNLLVRTKSRLEKANQKKNKKAALIDKYTQLIRKYTDVFDQLKIDSEAINCPQCGRTLAVHKSLGRVVCTCGFNEMNDLRRAVLTSYGQVIAPAGSN